MIVKIIIVLFIIVILFCLFFIITRDIKLAQVYKKATRVNGEVKKSGENFTLYAYGSGFIGMRRRVYRQYEVEYEINGNRYTGILQTKKKGLSPGDIVEVRYIWMEDSNEPQMVSCMYADRIKELAYGAIGGIILVIVIIRYCL